MFIRYEKFNFRKNRKSFSITLAVLVFLLIAPFSFINNRYEISRDGIFKYSNLGQIENKYSWSDISEAKIYISYVSYKTRGNYAFFYDIELKSGKCLRLYQDGYARDRLNSIYIVNNVLQQNNVHISRDKSNINKLDKQLRDRINTLFN